MRVHMRVARHTYNLCGHKLFVLTFLLFWQYSMPTACRRTLIASVCAPPLSVGSKKLRLHAPLVNTRLQVRATLAEYRPGPCQERAIRTNRVAKRKPSAISTLCPAALSRPCKHFPTVSSESLLNIRATGPMTVWGVWRHGPCMT